LIFPAQAFDWTSRNGANSLLAKINLLAEREGFEPPVRFPVHLISRIISTLPHSQPSATIRIHRQQPTATFSLVFVHSLVLNSDKTRTIQSAEYGLIKHQAPPRVRPYRVTFHPDHSLLTPPSFSTSQLIRDQVRMSKCALHREYCTTVRVLSELPKHA